MGCCAGLRQALASGWPSLAPTSSLTSAQSQVSGLEMAGVGSRWSFFEPKTHHRLVTDVLDLSVTFSLLVLP